MGKQLPQHIVERLRGVEQRLRDFIQKADKLTVDIAAIPKDMGRVDVMRGLEQAVPALTDLVRRILADNYARSGLGNSPRSALYSGQGNKQPKGWLRRMIANTSVKLRHTVSRGGNTLVPEYLITLGGASATDELHGIAAALNFGAVHTAMTMREKLNPADMDRVGESRASKAGRAAKRSLKKMALTGRMSGKALAAIRRGSSFGGVRVTRPMDIEKGSRHVKGGNPATNRAIFLGPEKGVHVSIPHPFFYFTQAQVGAMGRVVAAAIHQEA